MYVCVYKYIPDVLSIHIYIYIFTHGGNYRYEEVLRVILRHASWSWTAAFLCQDNQPAVNIQVYEGSESINSDDRNHPMNSGGFSEMGTLLKIANRKTCMNIGTSPWI